MGGFMGSLRRPLRNFKGFAKTQGLLSVWGLGVEEPGTEDKQGLVACGFTTSSQQWQGFCAQRGLQIKQRLHQPENGSILLQYNLFLASPCVRSVAAGQLHFIRPGDCLLS